MKKFVFIISFLLVGYSSIANTFSHINENLIRSFRETYPNAAEVTWREAGDTYTVFFTDEGVRSSLVFKKTGEFLSSIRYYNEDHLPYYLVAVVKGKFPGKKIYGVTEVSSKSRVQYFLKLQDSNSWMTVELNSKGTTHVRELFSKA